MKNALALSAAALLFAVAAVFCLHKAALERAARARYLKSLSARAAWQAGLRERLAADQAAKARAAAALAKAVARAAAVRAGGQAGADTESDSAQNGSPAAAVRAALRRRLLDAYRASLDSALALLIQKLHLSPEQLAGLKDLLVQREANNLQVDDAAREKGVDESDPQIQALDDELSSENKQSMRDLIGYDDERTVHQYLQEQSLLSVIDSVASSAAAGDAPLMPDQAQALLTALSDASQRTSSGGVLKNTVDWDAAESQAAAILSPVQMSAFAAVRELSQSSQAVNQAVITLNR